MPNDDVVGFEDEVGLGRSFIGFLMKKKKKKKMKEINKKKVFTFEFVPDDSHTSTLDDILCCQRKCNNNIGYSHLHYWRDQPVNSSDWV